jgi:uncharacterized protein YihD (DUF1040 family)
MHLDTLSRDELFKEIADLAREQGVADESMWKELVDQVIDSHLELGELDKDQDLVGLKTILQDSWGEYKREMGQERGATVKDI